jgi:hypothetical protein
MTANIVPVERTTPLLVLAAPGQQNHNSPSSLGLKLLKVIRAGLTMPPDTQQKVQVVNSIRKRAKKDYSSRVYEEKTSYSNTWDISLLSYLKTKWWLLVKAMNDCFDLS